MSGVVTDNEAGRLRLAMLWSVLALCLYFPALDYSFFADDEIYLAFSNRMLRDLPLSELHRLLLEPANPWEFLPVRDFSYWLDLRLFGDDGFGLHLTNLLLYTMAGISCAWFVGEALTVFRGRTLPNGALVAAATVGGALFLLHPAHVEAAVWISGRKDLLTGIFSLMALAMLLRASREGYRTPPLLLSGLLFGLACLSKSVAVATVLPALALLCRGLGDKQAWPHRTRIVIGLAVFVLIAVAALLIHLHFGIKLGIRVDNAPAVLERIERASRISASLVRLVFLPVDLGLFHDVYALGEWHWPVALLAMLLLGWAAHSLAMGRGGLLSLAVLVIVSPMLPYLQLVPFSTWSMASERFVFVSVAGVSLLLGGLAMRFNSRWLTLAIVAIFTVLAGVTWNRIGTWRSDQTLMEYEYERHPTNFVTVLNYVSVVLLPPKSEKMDAVISGVSRADAREMISRLVQLRVAERTTREARERTVVGNIDLPADYCWKVMQLYDLQTRGLQRLRHDPDLMFSNFLRSIDRQMYYSLGNPKRFCNSLLQTASP